MTESHVTLANKVPSTVFYKAVANLYPTKFSWPLCQEYYCLNIPIKTRKNDSVVYHCVFSPTVEQWFVGLNTANII